MSVPIGPKDVGTRWAVTVQGLQDSWSRRVYRNFDVDSTWIFMADPLVLACSRDGSVARSGKAPGIIACPKGKDASRTVAIHHDIRALDGSQREKRGQNGKK